MGFRLPSSYPHAALDCMARWCLVAFFFLMPLTLAGANLSMACTLVLWLLSGRFRERWQAVRHLPPTFPLLGLAGLILIGSLYTTGTPQEVLYHLLKYSKLLLLLAAASLLVHEPTRERCWTAFTAAMLLTLAMSYINIGWNLPWSKTHNLGWSADHSVFKDHITQGAMMALLMLRALRQGLAVRVRWQRALWWLVAVLAFVCNTQLSHGRTGYLATGAALVAFTLSQVGGRRKIPALAVLAVVLAGAVWLSPQIQERVHLAVSELGDYKTDTLSSIGQRMYFWEKSLELIAERPVLGWGTGSYSGQFCRVATTGDWCHAGAFHPHNQFLFFMVQHGIVGGLMFAAVLLMTLWGGKRCARADRSVTWGFVGILAVGSMTHSSLWLSSESFFYAFGLALVMAMG
ncbi:MAG: O-antigen ligase family protein, partial [Acidovorax sp.]|uniref:O-antigen ligase family protein n=1 Tax=Acidovorax sp. TaxID=1872122 RepID=UPI0039E2323C